MYTSARGQASANCTLVVSEGAEARYKGLPGRCRQATCQEQGQQRLAEQAAELLNQFSMDEYDGVLRVATTYSTAFWGGPILMDDAAVATVPSLVETQGAESGQARPSPAATRPPVPQSRVTTLRRDGRRLVRLGEVDGLGPTERIHAVRFTGPIGYLVTFRQTDPLYTLDLSDPARPVTRGELKIPGYSAYLHPAADGLLLGVGQDATDQGRVTGLSLSLFDVSDLTDPRRVARVKLAQAFSGAEGDHHAFTLAGDLALIPFQQYADANGQPRFDAGVLAVRRDGERLGEPTVLRMRADGPITLSPNGFEPAMMTEVPQRTMVVFSFTRNYSLLFGGAPVLTDVIQYFVVAQDLAATPNVGIGSGTFAAAPSSVALTSAAFPISGSVNSYTMVTAGLFGTVSVGATQAYHSLTEAGASGLFNAINTNGLSSNLFVEIVDASIPETGAIALNAINYNGCAAGPYQVYIKPFTGITTTLTGNSATALIKLNGADNVIIDGSYNGSSSKNMTITNTNTASSGNAVLWLASASSTDGATNNTIRNCIITGNASTTTLMGIFSGGTASLSTSGNALADNSANTIQNNTVSKSQYGIFVTGVSTAALSTGLTITGNTLGSSAAGDGFLTGGIDVRLQSGATISSNDVQNITGAGTVTMQGINLQDSKSSVVSANKVHFMNYSGASTTRLYGITTSTASFNVVGNQSANTYANNAVYDLVSNGTSSTWNVSGINNNGGYNDKYYYNSVYLTGQMSSTGTGSSATFSNGNAATTANCPVTDIRNNLFYMKGSSTVPSLLYVHYTTLSNYSGSTLNYNDLEGGPGGAAFWGLGHINNTDYFQLTDWRTATNKETNSISLDPLFASPTNLQLSIGSPCIGAGTPVSVTVDITGLTRSVTTPTIGAYEQAGDFTGPGCNRKCRRERPAKGRVLPGFA